MYSESGRRLHPPAHHSQTNAKLRLAQWANNSLALSQCHLYGINIKYSPLYIPCTVAHFHGAHLTAVFLHNGSHPPNHIQPLS